MTTGAYSDWIGRTETNDGILSTTSLAMLKATLVDVAPEIAELSIGDVMPLLWHWAGFPPSAPMTELGRDGHPKLGKFLPAVPLERRMWAGGRLTFHQPLRIGEPLKRRSEIMKVSEKSGAAGDMVFVTVAHEVSGEQGLALSEEQDIVYIAMPESYRPPKPMPAPKAPDFEERVPIDAVRLFRYSAATFNGHRIHYDQAYATDVEKYPGLVVHGPLQATWLMSAAVRHQGRTPQQFRFRGVHPMFHQHDLLVMGVADTSNPDEQAMELCTAAPERHQGMQARAVWS